MGISAFLLFANCCFLWWWWLLLAYVANQQTINLNLSHIINTHLYLWCVIDGHRVSLFIVILPSSGLCGSVWMGCKSSASYHLSVKSAISFRGNQNCSIDWSNRTSHTKLLCHSCSGWGLFEHLNVAEGWKGEAQTKRSAEDVTVWPCCWRTISFEMQLYLATTGHLVAWPCCLIF